MTFTYVLDVAVKACAILGLFLIGFMSGVYFERKGAFQNSNSEKRSK